MQSTEVVYLLLTNCVLAKLSWGCQSRNHPAFAIVYNGEGFSGHKSLPFAHCHGMQQADARDHNSTYNMAIRSHMRNT